MFFNLLCGLTNGYDICVTSALLNSISHELALCGDGGGQDGRVTSCPRKQAIMSVAAAGSFVSKLCLAWLADRFGRRAALAVVDCLIIAAVALQYLAEGSSQFLAGRFLLGSGLGLAFVVEPTYVCEIAPPETRGRYVVLNEVAVCVGCLLGLQVGTFVERRHGEEVGEWRSAMLLGALPAVLQLLFLFALPESPRWLALQGDQAGLERVAEQLGLSEAELESLSHTAQVAGRAEGGGAGEPRRRGLADLYDKQRRAWSEHGDRFALALTFSFFVPASGIYAMQAYGADVLRICGVQEPLRLLPFIGWLKLAGSLAAMAGADAALVGRRRLVTCGSFLCLAAQVVIAWRLSSPDTVPVGYAASLFFLFIFAWNLGYGSLQFAVALEILPNEVRGVWAGQIFFLVGIVETMIYQFFETLLLAESAATFLAFAAMNFLAMLFAACVMPDRQGRALEADLALPQSPVQRALSPAASPEPAVVGKPALQLPEVGLRRHVARKYGKLEEELPEELPEEQPGGHGS